MSAIDFEISVPQLRCFVAVASAGSIAEGGRRLGMSAASVSKALSRLEEGAGVRLLHRSTHALSLTEDGEKLLGLARETVRAAQEFEDAVAHSADRGDAGSLRVTAAVGLTRNVLAPALGELARSHPGIRVDVRASNETLDLADDGIDLAIRSGSLAGLPGHVQQVWFTCPWVICAAPSYLAGRPTPHAIADLDQHDVIGFRNLRTGRIEAWPHAGGRYEPNPRLSFDDGDTVWSAMLAGAGLVRAALSRRALHSDRCRHRGLAAIPRPRHQHRDVATRTEADSCSPHDADGVPVHPRTRARRSDVTSQQACPLPIHRHR